MKFIFKNYDFDATTGRATFQYGFENGMDFTETVDFQVKNGDFSHETLHKALQLAFVLSGVSYWKTFGDAEIDLPFELDPTQVDFFNATYQEGMGQYAFENHLNRENLAHFAVSKDDNQCATKYAGEGVLALQSGGKDSLLLASLLKKQGQKFTPFFVASGDHHPAVLDELGEDLVIIRRNIDREALQKAANNGARNGHIPVTYIVQSLALIQAILLNKNQVLVSIGHEGVEPHSYIGDLAVNHQWSKTREAEQLFSNYVCNYISPDLQIGSPIRQLSELKIAELFARYAWADFGHKFSSCNVANYRQHADNSVLKWCGNCPKCANAFLIFAPFVTAPELKTIFDNQDLFGKKSLEYSFKGLLDIDGVMKPFECVGETDELRLAYQMSQAVG
ncbi:MAG: hypothetical protein LBM09_01415, partial [Candidatus Nomurabacteria bacterium]|nr:hypothetical protein [Candidatus Nomurabacteria bacterium]